MIRHAHRRCPRSYYLGEADQNNASFLSARDFQPVRMYTKNHHSRHILFTFSLLELLCPEPSAAAASLNVLQRIHPVGNLALPTADADAAPDPLLRLLPATIRCCCARVGANVRFNKKAEERSGDKRRQPRASAVFLVINLGTIMSASRLARRSIVQCHRVLTPSGARDSDPRLLSPALKMMSFDFCFFSHAAKTLR